jgi:endonuclease/exonuclease/phosphatase family metal-dependent hydrolase
MGVREGTRRAVPGALAVAVALYAVAMATFLPTPAAPEPRTSPRMPTFRVATWNIRSGMGVSGFWTTQWRDDTLNCTDASQPLNAWGVGLPQKELQRLGAETSIVALALQEAWNCASPEKVKEVLGFKTASRQQQGVALLTRFGTVGPMAYHRVDATHDRWVIGGDVCLDAACSSSIPMFSTHWGGSTVEDSERQAAATVAVLRRYAEPQLLMGDLNVSQRNQWNPRVRCSGREIPGLVRALERLRWAGYIDSWPATQVGEGWTGMASRRGCGNPGGNLFKRIDYVFAKGVDAVGTTRFGRMPPGADSPSDHVGLIAEMAVPRFIAN